MRSMQLAFAGLVCAVVAGIDLSWATDSANQQSQSLVPRAVLKLIIDHPALAQYLHPEVAGRVPLVVSDHLLEPGVTPSKFGQPLRIVSDREAGAQPHIRIVKFAIDGPRAKLTMEYKAERVEATFNLTRDSSGWWSVVDAKVAER